MSATLSQQVDDLLGRVADGDTAAFARLDQEIRPAVFGVVLRVLRDRSLAEEVTQEVLLELWEKSDRFDASRGAGRGFVLTLARRRAVDRVRSEQASRNRDERVGRREIGQVADVADEVSVRLDHWQVRRALDALSVRQREAIELAYYAGHTYRDVADVLGIPEGTAKSRLRDGLARLREQLDGLV